MSSAGVTVSENACNVHALLSSGQISFTLGCQVFAIGIDQMMVFGAFDTLWVSGLTVTFGGTCCPAQLYLEVTPKIRAPSSPRNVGD